MSTITIDYWKTKIGGLPPPGERGNKNNTGKRFIEEKK